ncbi:phytanoyl-CoA dioxygenase family protein [Gluconacetobacter tumulisoli]|uniref:Phytanoyl-CoA dioxygenase family protein n=1 Tax=Gluconacetobacter tumulisoli TaxID=1286189 RepID=A0A7W4PKV3_9PROT|nr:phytanoyl-CoA dioxygenase family protein [Gluconacetobacter tumulisoli]MBB2201832.1 phytanoyl-CoA dioxygenase family protein [Gluconacetobacter tumulisoli]
MDMIDGTVRTLHPLTDAQVDAFHRDGFVIVPGFLDQEELSPLAEACAADPSIGGRLRAVADSDGHAQEVVAWTEYSNTYLGKVPFLARMVDNATALLGSPSYHWHSKLSMKRPHAPGRWDWHQDYPFWHDEGCLWPDMLTCSVAVDHIDEDNGCMKLVQGSHRLGRLNHARFGKAVSVDQERLALILDRLPVVPMTMKPGDACFFHANVLHASGPNRSDRNRTILHCSYNTIANTPFLAEGQVHHSYRPFAVLPDTLLQDHDYAAIFDGHLFNQDTQPVLNGGKTHDYGYTLVNPGT